MESGTPPRDTAWAMSQESIALVRQTFGAWNEGGPEAAKQFYAEDIEWHDFPGLPDRRGGASTGPKAASTFPARSHRYGRSRMAGFSVCGCSRRGRKPSKPPGCG